MMRPLNAPNAPCRHAAPRGRLVAVMPRVTIPNSAGLHTLRSFLTANDFFGPPAVAVVELHPRWVHVEPVAIAMLGAWGGWCKRVGKKIDVRNLKGASADYLWRMHLFQHLDFEYSPDRTEHEEAGRFLPLTNVRGSEAVSSVMGDISALLHLHDNPDTLAAVQYCISELLRNVLEHSSSPEGAYVCAHNYSNGQPPRITIAVADCGTGIAAHLGDSYPLAKEDHRAALQLAMRPGITGARPGIYGTPDNQGVGLFITRCIAKGSGGYFAVLSSDECYRLRRARNADEQTELFEDAFEDRHDLWHLPHPWQGTVVAVEIRVDQIEDFSHYFSWIRDKIPARTDVRRRIKFT
jgi:hypothetical protein